MSLTLNTILRLERTRLSAEALRWCFLAIASGVTLGLLGCTATYTAGITESPDGRYCIYGHVRGAYGHSFIDQTEKVVDVDITGRIDGGEKSLLKKEYRIYGADVGWHATWDEHHNVIVTFFDYGPVNYWSDAKKNGIPKRQIRMVTYRFDSNTVTFAEQSSK